MGFSNIDTPDDYYYHVTTPSGADAIMKTGVLQPGDAQSMAPGFYRDYSKGKVFLADRNGVSFWKDRIGAHIEHGTGKTPNLVVVRIPKKVLEGLSSDALGTKDSHAGSCTVTSL